MTGSALGMSESSRMPGPAVANAGAAAPPSEIWVPPGHGRINQLDRLKNLPDIQRALCSPAENPDWATYFIVNFCHTMDEDAGNRIHLIGNGHGEAKPHIVQIIRHLDFKDPITVEPLAPANLHVKKSRRMTFTWILAAYNVGCLQEDPTYTARIISKNEDAVDDSGHTNDSIFGRMRFIWDRLPVHLKRGIEWAYMRAQNRETQAYVRGGAPTQSSGRGTGPKRFYADEHAHLPYADAIHQSADPACKFGKVYSSSVNGPDNLFAEIDEKKFPGWRFVDLGWEHDPEKAVGIRETVPGPERDRYGPLISPYLVDVTQSLSDEDIHQEYGRNYEKSTKGMIHREFSRELHASKRLHLDPALPLWVGSDFGHARKQVCLIAQPIGMLKLRIFGRYAGEFRNGPDNAQALTTKLRQLGYRGRLEDICFVPDPASLNEEIGTGLSQISWWRAEGYTNIVLPRITGPDSVYLGNQVVRALFGRNMIEIDPVECEDLIKNIPAYRLPIDRITGDAKSNVPLHNMASHDCDTLRYLTTAIWTADDLPYEGFISTREPIPVRARDEDRSPVDGRLPDPIIASDDRDVFRTVATQKRVF